MDDHQYQELDARREIMVMILEGLSLPFIGAICVVAWVMLPA